jgi:hypothetical protein
VSVAVGTVLVAGGTVACTKPPVPRFVALAGRVVYASDGGDRWAPTASQPGAAGAWVLDVARSDKVDIAVGQQDGQPVIWTSADGGTTWSVTASGIAATEGWKAKFAAVSCRGPRCVAAAEEEPDQLNGAHPGPVARSDDGGVTWRSTTAVPRSGSINNWVRTVEVGDDGTIVVGVISRGPGTVSSISAALVTTHDGERWTQFDRISAGPFSGGPVLVDVHRSGSVWVALANTGPFEAASTATTFVSSDNADTWVATAPPPAPVLNWAVSTAAVGGQRVAAVSSGSSPAVAFTADGATWRTVALPAGLVAPTAVAWSGSTLVAAFQTSERLARVAVSHDDGATWQVASAPPPTERVDALTAG